MTTGVPAAKSVAQLIPDVRVVGGNVSEADAGRTNSTLNPIDGNVYVWILIYAIRIEASHNNCRLEYLLESLVKFVSVKWLNHETCGHGSILVPISEVKTSSGAKAQHYFSAICGTTEVVPCYKALRFAPNTSFSAACEVAP
jgi:hypothetical protein